MSLSSGWACNLESKVKLSHSTLVGCKFSSLSWISSWPRAKFVPPSAAFKGAAAGVRELNVRAWEARETSKRRKSRGFKQRGGRGVRTEEVQGSSDYGYWRLLHVEVPFELDPGKDDFSLHEALMNAVALVLSCRAKRLPRTAFTLVRKSLDARKEPKFIYAVDVDVKTFLEHEPHAKNILSVLKVVPGKYEFSPTPRTLVDLVSRLQNAGADKVSSSEEFREKIASEHPCSDTASNSTSSVRPDTKRARVVVVGSGPAGLFAALTLVESGANVTIVERGQPVEARGRDIGTLMARKLLDPDSNFCYGEGGAGTWSDGKLTTRIGKNSSSVQTVLATLVRFGAPTQILVDGKPHVGTDKLIGILRRLRSHLEALGVRMMFGAKMEDLDITTGRVTGVLISKVDHSSAYEILKADAVVLAVGHSARDVYENIHSHNVVMTPKPFAVGFRVEHPQELINELQYHKFASEVQMGKGRLPVADYKLAAGGLGRSEEYFDDMSRDRSCFSFCMCPGGQIVPTSTSPSELCVNGMSFSRRSSKWANAAMVVSVDSSDFDKLGPLAGVAFQRSLEQEAAIRGGGNFVAPVQKVTDFLDDKLSEYGLPSSSYRLGVRAAPLHDLLPSDLTNSLKSALLNFERQLPGFLSEQALLHAVETRTSAPLRIDRDERTFESLSHPGLYPTGEGAGYAGGIVSAAVDGMRVGLALSKLYVENPSLYDLCLEA